MTIRDVPNVVRSELAARAVRAGQSLQEYLGGVMVATAAKPTSEDMLDRARARVPAGSATSAQGSAGAPGASGTLG